MAVKFKKASADEARAKRKEHVKDLASGTAVLKGFKAPPSWNKESRSARFIMSSESVDRYRDIVVQSGIDTTAFEKNPQGLLFHNSRSWPIGIWSDITKVLSGRPKRTEGVLNFLPEGTDEDADRAARHVEAGSMRTVSIGFIPDWEDVDFILDDDEDWTGGFRFNKCELIECSLVPVPAQPDALVKDAGGDMQLARDLIEDILDNYAKSPEGLLIPLDAYSEKHFELAGNRTSIIVDKALLPAVKFVAPADMKISASTDEEAKSYIGAKVALDPGHSENKEFPSSEWSKDTGEVIASWIVPEGEFKGVHALAVEFLTTHAVSGMLRGAKAERFLLIKSDEEPEESTEDDKAKSSESEEQTAETAETKDADKLTIKLDVVQLGVDTNLAETQKQVEQLESTIDRVFGKIAKLFGRSVKDTPAAEKKEPELTVEPEVREPPTAEEISAAKARAAEIRERLVAKGMIAAE